MPPSASQGQEPTSTGRAGARCRASHEDAEFPAMTFHEQRRFDDARARRRRPRWRADATPRHVTTRHAEAGHRLPFRAFLDAHGHMTARHFLGARRRRAAMARRGHTKMTPRSAHGHFKGFPSGKRRQLSMRCDYRQKITAKCASPAAAPPARCRRSPIDAPADVDSYTPHAETSTRRRH